MEKEPIKIKNTDKIHLGELREFISNWSGKRIGKEKIDERFQVGNFPLSWYYRPIVYSSLLPKMFPCVEDLIKEEKHPKRGMKLTIFLLRKYLTISENIKRQIRKVRLFFLPPPEKTIKKKVLILSFTRHVDKKGNVLRIQNIFDQIKSDGKYEPLLIFADQTSNISLRKLWSCEIMLYDYHDAKIFKSARLIAKSLSAKWKEISETDKRKILLFKNIDIYSKLKPNLDFIYSFEFIKQVCSHYFTFSKIIKQEDIGAIILTSQNNLFEKTIIAAAEREDIPVIIIQHGIGLGLPTIDTPKNITFAVFGNHHKKNLLDFGVKEENIITTGPIIFDGIERYINKNKKPEKKILLATSSYIEDLFIEKEVYFQRLEIILKQLCILTKKINIKLHPRETNKRDYVGILKKFEIDGDVYNDSNRETHYTLIQDSDLIITFGSTVALEAMIIGRPTVTIELLDSSRTMNRIIVESETSPVVSYKENIIKVVNENLKENNFKQRSEEFVQELCFKIDGCASKRCIDYIYKQIDKNNITPRQLFHK